MSNPNMVVNKITLGAFKEHVKDLPDDTVFTFTREDYQVNYLQIAISYEKQKENGEILFLDSNNKIDSWLNKENPIRNGRVFLGDYYVRRKNRSIL